MKNLLVLLFITVALSAQTRPPDKVIPGYNLALVTTNLNKAAAAVTGSGTANLLTYWTGTTTIGSLATATYPSLTELARVKGVTSSIQTQLNSKQATLIGSGTGQNIKTINGNSLPGTGNIVITSTADTTGLWLKIYTEVKRQLIGDMIIGTATTLDSMIVDWRKNNVLRVEGQ